MVDAVSESRIEQQTTMMNRGSKMLILGSMNTMMIKKALTVVTMVAAMAVPALADYDVIDTTVTILNGETVNASGDMDMKNGTLDVQVGGVLNAAVEMKSFEGNSHMIVNGTAYIEQMKLYGPGDVIVGNGTDAATLTILEGFVGKEGATTITINAGSTMIVDADWMEAFSIDSVEYKLGSGGHDSYIDLVGGTLKISTATSLRAGHGNLMIGYGGTGTVSSEVIGDYTVYTGVARVPPDTVIIIK